MKDFLGNELSEGDEVVYLQRWGDSSELRRAKVIGFTKCFVQIETKGRACQRVSPEKTVRI